jgi:hypothetical protein
VHVQQAEGDGFDSLLRAQARRSLAAAAVLGLAVVFLLLGLVGGPTFLFSPVWWGVVGALALAGVALVARAGRKGAAVRAEAAARGLDLGPLQRRVAPSRPRVVVWALLLIGWLSALVVVGGPALAAAELGHRTERAVAQQAVSWMPCPHCSRRAKAVILVGSRSHEVNLRGVAQDPSYYAPGIVVVFRAGRPDVAMALADYRDGAGPLPAIVGGTSTVVFLLGTWLLVRFRPRSDVRRGLVRR